MSPNRVSLFTLHGFRVKDNCRAITLALQRGKVGEIYNIGGNCEKRNIDVVNLICAILKGFPKTQNLRPKIQFIKDPRGAAHDFRYALNCAKIGEELGWQPECDFEVGLKQKNGICKTTTGLRM